MKKLLCIFLFIIGLLLPAYADGNFGIGVAIEQRDGNFYISKILNSDVSDLGISEGDEIISVNNELVKDMTLDEVVSKLKGEEKSTVKIAILAKNQEIKNYEIPRTCNIKFEQIKVNIWSLLENREYTEILTTSNKYLEDNDVKKDKFLLCNIYFVRGVARYALKDYSGSMHDYYEAAFIVPDKYAFNGLGDCNLKIGNYDEALKWYIISIRYDKDNPGAFEGKAYACLGLKKYQEYYKNLNYAKEQYLKQGNTEKYKEIVNLINEDN